MAQNNALNQASEEFTATTSYATTFDTNVAAAGMTIAGTTIAADGTDANIDITITPKGTGTVNPSALSVNSAYTFPTSDGTADQVLTTDGSGVVSWVASSTVGNFVQEKSSNRTSVFSTSSVIPPDDTIPQNTEGAEVLTVSITPTSATNILVIEFNTFLNASALGGTGAALFQDSTANALAATCLGTIASSGYLLNGSLRHVMTAGTTSATTFKIRAGMLNAGPTLYLSGYAGSRLFGGVASTVLTVKEYKP